MVYLRNVRCAGLYSYAQTIDLKLSDHSAIVGPNNSGKSNIFRIIKLFEETFSKKRHLQDYEICAGATDIFLDVALTLSKDEVGKIIDFFSFYQEPPNHYSQYYYFRNRESLYEKLTDARIKVSWIPNIQSGGSEPDVEFEFEKLGLSFYSRGVYGTIIIKNKKPANVTGYSMIQNVSLNEFIDNLSSVQNGKEFINRFFESAGDQVLIMHQINPGVSPTMPDVGKKIVKELYDYLGLPLGRNYYIDFNAIFGRILRTGVFHATERRSFSKTLSDYVNLLKTGEDDFNKKLVSVANSYAMNRADYLENDGSNLFQFLFTLKESPTLEERERFAKIKDAFENIFRSEKLSFELHLEYERRSKGQVIGADEYLKAQRPTIVIVDESLNKQYPLDQVGSGLHEVIYLLALSYGINNSVVLLDEPSVNLHPPLMKSMMKLIETTKDNQFIIITHSPELVQYELFEGKSVIVYVRKNNHASSLTTLDPASSEWLEKNRSRLKHQIDTRIFFGKCVILTEGESDRNLLGIAEYFESEDEKLSLTKNDVIVTSVGGKENFVKYRKILDAFGIRYLILADSNARGDFNSESVGSITKQAINGKGPAFIIENGNLEDFMIDIDAEIYREVKSEFGNSKPTVAFEFMKRISGKNTSELDSLKSFLQMAITKAQNG